MSLQKELITPSGRRVRFEFSLYSEVPAVRRVVVVTPITLFWGTLPGCSKTQWILRGSMKFPLSGESERLFPLDQILEWDPVRDPRPHMVLIKQDRYVLERRVLIVAEDEPGGRKRVYYRTGRGVETSCWIESWAKWARTASRAWWDGEDS